VPAEGAASVRFRLLKGPVESPVSTRIFGGKHFFLPSITRKLFHLPCGGGTHVCGFLDFLHDSSFQTNYVRPSCSYVEPDKELPRKLIFGPLQPACELILIIKTVRRWIPFRTIQTTVITYTFFFLLKTPCFWLNSHCPVRRLHGSLHVAYFPGDIPLIRVPHLAFHHTACFSVTRLTSRSAVFFVFLLFVFLDLGSRQVPTRYI